MQLPSQTPLTPEAKQLETALFEVKRVIVGQDRAIERLFVCLLAQGHCLLEGVPGLAKTLAMETLARVSGGTFTRIQFTPDLLPADIVGTRIYRTSSERFDVELGPVFANFVLADEVNRAPAKVQSALLEVMAEHQVSIGGRTFEVPEPFLVLATQNPVEQEGVYPLPEAQRDRFLMKVTVGYPSPAEEVEIVNRMGVAPPVPRQALSADDLLMLQSATKAVYVDRGVVDYAVALVLATRSPDEYGVPELTEFIEYGASPRASLGLVAAARALALMRGRRYALPQDVFDVAPEILRHRLVLSYEAIAQGLHVDQISARILSTVPAPRVAPSQEQAATAYAGFQPAAQQTGGYGTVGYGGPTGGYGAPSAAEEHAQPGGLGAGGGHLSDPPSVPSFGGSGGAGGGAARPDDSPYRPGSPPADATAAPILLPRPPGDAPHPWPPHERAGGRTSTPSPLPAPPPRPREEHDAPGPPNAPLGPLTLPWPDQPPAPAGGGEHGRDDRDDRPGHDRHDHDRDRDDGGTHHAPTGT